VNTNEQPNLVPPIPENAECTVHIPADPLGPDGTTQRALCGAEVAVSSAIKDHFEDTGQWVSCPLCEAAYELNDPQLASDCFTAAVKSFCDFQRITLRQVALRAHIPLSTFYSRTAGRSAWGDDEISRIVDALESTLPEAKSRRS
jgi:hypothetical protein